MILLFLISLFFIGCEEKIHNLEVYQFVKLKKANITPLNRDLEESGIYKISLDNNLPKPLQKAISLILRKNKNIQITQDINSNYSINGKIEQISQFMIGQIIIFNKKLNIQEKRFPIMINLFDKGNNSFLYQKQLLKLNFNKFFEFKNGYILSKKIGDNSKTIFEISLGSNQGIKKGDIVSIYDLRKGSDFLTNKKKLKRVKIAFGIVSNKIYKNRAWIFLKKENYSAKIRLGNLVTVGYNNFGDYIEDGKQILNNHSEILN